MSVVTISIRPVESLHLGMRNLGGVEVFSIDEVVNTPLPSTVLGAVGSLLGITINKGGSHSNYDLHDIKQLIKEIANAELDFDTYANKNPILWGPLIKINHNRYIPIGSKLLSEDDAREYIKRAIGFYGGEEPSGLRMFDYAEPMGKVGIELNEDTKTVSRMFRARYVAYKHELEFMYLMRLSKDVSGITRLGGEGRLAVVSLGEELKPPTEGTYAIALQPILMHTNETVADIGEVRGLKCVDEVYGVFDGEKFRVKVIDVGLGFSEVNGFRRPMLKALPQGTVVKLKDDDKCWGAIAIGLLSTLGYGSIYRVDYRG
jgi:CRISPR-associated protein Cmr3